MNQYMTLNDIKVGESAVVIKILSDDPMKYRFYDLGLVEGTRVRCELVSPTRDPVAFLFRGALIAIRREDAEKIVVDGCLCDNIAEVENECDK